MLNKSYEDSCKELQAWKERLCKLDECNEEELRAYFSLNNIWVENPETIGCLIGNGAESYIYKSHDGKEVYKLKRSRVGNVVGDIKGIINLLEKTLNHNKVFPDTYYSLIGFTSNEKGLCIILGQEFVNGEFATKEQISAHLKKDGFTLISTGRDKDFLALKKGFQVTDIKSQNAIFANNRVYIIDCCISKYN